VEAGGQSAIGYFDKYIITAADGSADEGDHLVGQQAADPHPNGNQDTEKRGLAGLQRDGVGSQRDNQQ